MKKLHLIVFMLICIPAGLLAQKNRLHLDLGGMYTNFQDYRFSSLHQSGGGLQGRIAWDRQNEDNSFGIAMNFEFGIETFTAKDYTVNRIHPKLEAYYLRRINEKWQLGLNWTAAELFLRTTSGLGNNGSMFDFSSSIAAQGRYQTQLWGKPLLVDMGIGLVGLNKMSTSFAYRAPQQVLENGEFNFQNESISNPIGKSGMHIDGPWKDIRISTGLTYMLSKRFTLYYRWEMRRYAVVKGYPTTHGSNVFGLQFNFINK